MESNGYWMEGHLRGLGWIQSEGGTWYHGNGNARIEMLNGRFVVFYYRSTDEGFEWAPAWHVDDLDEAKSLGAALIYRPRIVH
jgi:hypothetical protein